MTIDHLDFPLAKAEYLLNHATPPGEGKFWRIILGFSRAEDLREAILAQVTIDRLRSVGRNPYGERHQAIIPLYSPSRITWQIKTVWIVLEGENVARFITAIPERFGRQP